MGDSITVTVIKCLLRNDFEPLEIVNKFELRTVDLELLLSRLYQTIEYNRTIESYREEMKKI
ncbi:hypothetical protein [Enterobacter kobei]|uniref:hypothetical protein n=1 Tax=Enterobacter kobei TaxID=208224 RepID=UPI0018A4DE62|nr:hypothetical protein [Enterobacter kobei]BBV85988.1 hypothetical protein STW0522ENT62_14340 [Enterobacter kobei]